MTTEMKTRANKLVAEMNKLLSERKECRHLAFNASTEDDKQYWTECASNARSRLDGIITAFNIIFGCEPVKYTNKTEIRYLEF